MISNYKNIIIAPHPDDELIGCYELLVHPAIDKEVVVFTTWFNEDLQTRIKESENLASDLEYNLIIIDNILSDTYIKLLSYDIMQPAIIWLPSLDDNNQHHTYTNVYTKLVIEQLRFSGIKNLYIGEYTTKMNTKYKRLTSNVNDKKNKLYKYFPSQSKYFDNYNDLYIFEGRILIQ